MSPHPIFAKLRSSPAFLKPQPAAPGTDVYAVLSFIATLMALFFGWAGALLITVLIAVRLQPPASTMVFAADFALTIGLAWVLAMLIRRFSRSRVEVFPVIVRSKREKEHRDDETDSLSYTYWVVFEFENGEQGEYNIDRSLYLHLFPPCAGVAQLHSYDGSVMRYDPIFEKI